MARSRRSRALRFPSSRCRASESFILAGVQTSGRNLQTSGGILRSGDSRGRAELREGPIMIRANMHFLSIALLLIAWMAVVDAVSAAEAVTQDPGVPAAGQPAAAKPAPSAAPASKGQAPGEMLFAPPPVPDFMLKKPAKPLTTEEMQKQADEAAERDRARRAREAGGGASPAQEPKTGTTGARSEPPRM